MTLWVREPTPDNCFGCIPKYHRATWGERKRADGWTECGTCGGKGEGSYDVEGWAGTDTAYVDCPDCAFGLVPPDWMIEAAAEGIFYVERPEWNGWNGRKLPPEHRRADQFWLCQKKARAALVAAARKEKP